MLCKITGSVEESYNVSVPRHLPSLARSGQIPLVSVKGRADLDKPCLAIAQLQVAHHPIQIKMLIQLENIARHKLQWGVFKAGFYMLLQEVTKYRSLFSNTAQTIIHVPSCLQCQRAPL